jgi:hypothetical protein
MSLHVATNDGIRGVPPPPPPLPSAPPPPPASPAALLSSPARCGGSISTKRRLRAREDRGHRAALQGSNPSSAFAVVDAREREHPTQNRPAQKVRRRAYFRPGRTGCTSTKMMAAAPASSHHRCFSRSVDGGAGYLLQVPKRIYLQYLLSHSPTLVAHPAASAMRFRRIRSTEAWPPARPFRRTWARGRRQQCAPGTLRRSKAGRRRMAGARRPTGR